jgi:hypothetical protein
VIQYKFKVLLGCLFPVLISPRVQDPNFVPFCLVIRDRFMNQQLDGAPPFWWNRKIARTNNEEAPSATSKFNALEFTDCIEEPKVLKESF